MRILLVEDDTAIALPLVQGLTRAGFVVDRVGRVDQAMAALDQGLPDILLLDLGLPDGDGLDIARTVRGRADIPILVLSARGEELDQVVGLEVGADDYLVKPFGLRELVARIRAVSRRAGNHAEGGASSLDPGTDVEDVTVLGGLTIDRARHRVRIDGAEVDLTPKEFDLLAFLGERPGFLHRREAILDAVWDHAWYGPTKTLDVHVGAVRRKLGDPAWIETVRGVGFRLVDPADRGSGP